LNPGEAAKPFPVQTIQTLLTLPNDDKEKLFISRFRVFHGYPPYLVYDSGTWFDMIFLGCENRIWEDHLKEEGADAGYRALPGIVGSEGSLVCESG
jgi:hypothetical protein